jgi:chromosome segregation ATPase
MTTVIFCGRCVDVDLETAGMCDEDRIDYLTSLLRQAGEQYGLLQDDHDALRTERALLTADLSVKRASELRLRDDLSDMQAVAVENSESRKRLQERAETAERRLQQATDGETDEEVQRLRELVDKAYQQAAARLAECDEAKRVVEELRGRAQKAEAALSTVKMQHEKDRTALAGFREANGEMGRQMEADQQRIRHFEQVIDGLRAEVSHSTVEAPDAVA